MPPSPLVTLHDVIFASVCEERVQHDDENRKREKGTEMKKPWTMVHKMFKNVETNLSISYVEERTESGEKAKRDKKKILICSVNPISSELLNHAFMGG